MARSRALQPRRLLYQSALPYRDQMDREGRRMAQPLLRTERNFPRSYSIQVSYFLSIPFVLLTTDPRSRSTDLTIYPSLIDKSSTLSHPSSRFTAVDLTGRKPMVSLPQSSRRLTLNSRTLCRFDNGSIPKVFSSTVTFEGIFWESTSLERKSRRRRRGGKRGVANGKLGRTSSRGK